MFMFVDRTDAGEKLAAKLLEEPLVMAAPPDKLLVLSIPRGGVVIGAAISRTLGCAHKIIAVKKLGFPGQEELAIGAIAEDEALALNKQVTQWFQSAEEDYLTIEIQRATAQLETQIQKFRHGHRLDVSGRTIILVDDGIATGETMKAALIWLLSRPSSQHPQHIFIATPVCSPKAARDLRPLVDHFICLVMPEQFWAVGQFYWDFDQVNDQEVKKYLAKPSHAAAHRVKSKPIAS
jgi:predicted phosphoribosyltransferase